MGRAWGAAGPHVARLLCRLSPLHTPSHPNLHVAFGSGIHHCLGATLARLEGQEAFRALAQRFPTLRMETEELEYQPSLTFRSIKAMPVTWS